MLRLVRQNSEGYWLQSEDSLAISLFRKKECERHISSGVVMRGLTMKNDKLSGVLQDVILPSKFTDCDEIMKLFIVSLMFMCISTESLCLSTKVLNKFYVTIISSSPDVMKKVTVKRSKDGELEYNISRRLTTSPELFSPEVLDKIPVDILSANSSGHMAKGFFCYNESNQLYRIIIHLY